jgi:hypothetical protein
VRERQSVCQGATTAQRLVDIARPWLRFLGWWRAPVAEFRFQNELDRYVAWMRDERGLSRLTVERWQTHARIFLLWCEQTDQRLATLRPGDVDRYFIVGNRNARPPSCPFVTVSPAQSTNSFRPPRASAASSVRGAFAIRRKARRSAKYVVHNILPVMLRRDLCCATGLGRRVAQ